MQALQSIFSEDERPVDNNVQAVIYVWWGGRGACKGPGVSALLGHLEHLQQGWVADLGHWELARTKLIQLCPALENFLNSELLQVVDNIEIWANLEGGDTKVHFRDVLLQLLKDAILFQGEDVVVAILRIIQVFLLV